MSKVFISYRRSDSQWQTKQLYDALCAEVAKPKENIFYDLDSMLVGFDFRERIDDAVSKCDVLIAVIGNRWLTEVDPKTGERRIDNPRDFVRLEIASALKRNIQVVPVLVDSTIMPQAEDLPEELQSLAFRHGVNLRVDSFDSDMSALIRGLNLTERAEASGEGDQKLGGNADEVAPPTRKRWTKWMAALGIFAVGSLIYTYMMFSGVDWDALLEEEVASRQDEASPAPPETNDTGLPSAIAIQYQGECSTGIVESCTFLGYLYEKGEGVEKNVGRAFDLYQQGCDGGHNLGCSNLGVMFEKGMGTTVDFGRAVELYTASCDAGAGLGCTNLGRLYSTGLGVTASNDRSNELYRKACDLGEPAGCTELGYHYERGVGLTPSIDIAVDLYQQGCAGGDALGCNNLGFMYEKGTVVRQDVSRALSLYRQACDSDNLPGCHNLGKLYEVGNGVSQNYETAISLYERACSGGFAIACTDLGFFYERGLGVSVDLQRAVQLYLQGCDGGAPQSCNNLGFMYQNGTGIAQNTTRALELFEQSCAAGNSMACTNLRNLRGR